MTTAETLASAPKTFALTAKQQELNQLLASPATHILAYGGSRSGKTLSFCRAIAVRAMKAPGSRHLIARYRFNHVIQSVLLDTWPKMMTTCFPEARFNTDKQNYFISLPNGSEVWFAGLDEKERTEKALGTEFSTLFLNECSQISLSARNLIITRLAQNCGLTLRAYYDCNPPVATHWTHRLFLEKREAIAPHSPLKNPEAYAHVQMNPRDNADNLPATYLAELQSLPARERLRFWEGKFGDVGENALWTFETIESYRVSVRPSDLRRVIIGVDPSGTKGDDGGDTVGIVVVGLGMDGKAYVLEDASVKAPPHVWGRVVVNCADRHMADCVVAETNYGGAMVKDVIRTASADSRLRVPFKEVTASRGKAVRAEPIAALYEQGKVAHCGTFPALEDEMIAFTTHGYMGDGSPDRVDSLVWALTEIFPRVTSSSAQNWQSTSPYRSPPSTNYINPALSQGSTPRERHAAKMRGRDGSQPHRPRARPQERGIWAKPGWK